MKTLSLQYLKEHENEIFGGVEDYDYRLERAMVKMDRMRCPLILADSELHNEMTDALCDYLNDNEAEMEDYFTPEDIIF